MEGAQIPKRNSQETYTHKHIQAQAHTQHTETLTPHGTVLFISKFAPETHFNGKTIPIKIDDDVMCNRIN